MTVKRVERPSGWPPPTEADVDGRVVALRPLAEEITRRHLERHPEDVERYGDAAVDWGIHDCQWILSWAYGDAAGYTDLAMQVSWLAGVLGARGYPLENLASFLRTAAEVVGDAEVAERLRTVAASVPPA